MDAYEGYALANGIKKPDSLNADDVAELRQMLDADIAKQK